MENNNYKQYDQIYGLLHSAKSIIEMTKRTKETITSQDVEYIRNYLNDNIEQIIKGEY